MKLLKLLSLIFVLFAAVTVSAQDTVIDSLKLRLQNAETDKEKARFLNLLASEYIGNDPVKMESYANQALLLSQQKGLRMQEADAWLNLGNVNILKSNYTEALKSFSNSQDIIEEILAGNSLTDAVDIRETKDALATAYGSIGIVFSEQNNYARALEFYFKALKIYRKSKQEDIEAILYNNIGIVYQGHKENDKALQYFEKALAIQKKLGDGTAAMTMSNIGNIYTDQGKYPQALQFFKDSEKMLEEYKNQRALGELYNSYGNYYAKTDNSTKAEEHYQLALATFNEIGEKYGAASSLNFLGELYKDKGDNAQALAYFNKAALYGEETGVLEHIQTSEKNLSDIYERQGNYREALLHYKKYTTAKDSIINAENIRNMVREEMNFEMERRAALQKTENEKKEVLYNEQEKRHRQQMIFAGLLVLLLVGFAFVMYNRLQIKKTLTLQRDLAEYEQKALHLQMNPHFVFNCLGSISSFIVQNGTDSAIKYLSKFSKLMRLTLEYSKESLIPIDKEIESLQNYLELEQLRFNKMFDFSITKDPEIEDDMAIPPLLLQPFVENAIIHGIVPKKEKGMIAINFSLENNNLVCTVTDNGIGYTQSKALKENSVTVHKSMALEITRKRLEVIQAFTAKTSKVAITEVVGADGTPSGTKIVLNLPVQYAAN